MARKSKYGSSYGNRYKKKRRSYHRDPLLFVSARVNERRASRMHKVGAITMLLVALAGVIWLAVTGMKATGSVLFLSLIHI